MTLLIQSRRIPPLFHPIPLWDRERYATASAPTATDGSVTGSRSHVSPRSLLAYSPPPSVPA